MTRKGLTTRQKQILKFISEFIEKHKYPPTRAQLATYFGFRSQRLGKKSSAKGMVVTVDDLARSRKTFRAYSAIYPLVWAVTRLDAVVPASGYMLIASARRRAI